MIEPGHREPRRPGEAEAASGLLPGVLELGDQRRQIAVGRGCVEVPGDDDVIGRVGLDHRGQAAQGRVADGFVPRAPRRHGQGVGAYITVLGRERGLDQTPMVSTTRAWVNAESSSLWMILPDRDSSSWIVTMSGSWSTRFCAAAVGCGIRAPTLCVATFRSASPDDWLGSSAGPNMPVHTSAEMTRPMTDSHENRMRVMSSTRARKIPVHGRSDSTMRAMPILVGSRSWRSRNAA